MSDQKQLWNSLQQRDQHRGDPSAFAEEVLSIVPTHSEILELGCGVGNDAIGFAQAGHTVVATDFSDVAVKKNAEDFQSIQNLSFQVLDTSEPMPFADNTFDVVYARLSLHYFTDVVTRSVFTEIHRVLRSDGYLCFVCKSVRDPLYGQGTQMEPDMFEHKGHIRHFFSEVYAKSVMGEMFSIEKIESGEDVFYLRKSAYVKVIARAAK